MNKQAYETHFTERPQPKTYTVLRLFFYLFIASVTYWGGVMVLYWIARSMSGFLYNFLETGLYLDLVNSKELILLLGYFALILSIIGRYVYKLQKDINEINRAASELLTMEPKLPEDIRRRKTPCEN